MTDVVFRARHGLVALPMIFAYAYLNYRATIAKGSPVYWFLTWEDSTSIFIAIGIATATFLAFFVLAKLTQVIKRPMEVSE